MADRVGQQLGNYRLVRLLGQGGFADVYLGEHIHLDTRVAVKVLRTRLANIDVEQFRSEARIIAQLVHPHIVRVFDFGIDAMIPFLVIDYAAKGTLFPSDRTSVMILVPKTMCPTKATIIFSGLGDTIRVPWNCSPSPLTSASQYSGTWLNDDSNTRDIPRLIISNVGQTLNVHG